MCKLKLLFLRIFYKFLDIIWISNLHWGYILINEGDLGFYPKKKEKEEWVLNIQ